VQRLGNTAAALSRYLPAAAASGVDSSELEKSFDTWLGKSSVIV
jgi:hypothetical protein